MFYAKYKHKASTPIEEIIYGLDSGYKAEDPIFVEGSFDCIRMRSFGLNCYSTLSNNVSDKQAELIKKYFTGTIYVMHDNDKGGIQMVDKFKELLYHSYPIRICKLPKSVKDPDGMNKKEALISKAEAKLIVELEAKKTTKSVSIIQRTILLSDFRQHLRDIYFEF